MLAIWGSCLRCASVQWFCVGVVELVVAVGADAVVRLSDMLLEQVVTNC